MPPTLLSVGIIFFGFTSLVYGELNHRLVSNEELFGYYPPESADVRSLTQEQKQHHRPDSPAPLSSQHSINPQNQFQSGETSLLANGLYPMPPLLPQSDPKESDSVISSIQNDLQVGLLNQDEGEDDMDGLEHGDFSGLNTVSDFISMSKRTGFGGNRPRVLRPNAKERLRRPLRPNAQSSAAASWATQEIKRQRTSPNSLSVESSLNVLRHRFLQQLHRQRQMEKEKENEALLSSLGKRAASHSS